MRTRLQTGMVINQLAAHVNREGITCRKRTPDEERAYIAALPPRKAWVDPASQVEVKASVVTKVNKMVKRRKCTRARACHDCGCTVGQYNRAVRRIEVAK